MNWRFLFPKANRDYDLAKQTWQRFQETDNDELPSQQLEKIREMWSDAVVDVPYYGKLVEQGRAPAEISGWEDFFMIPVLTREVLQDRREEFVRRSGPPDLWRMTGGSTGNPIKFGVWNSEDEVIRMLKLVLWARVGYVPADRLFLIWGHSHLLGTGWRRHWNHFLRKAKDELLGYKRVNAYSLSRERCEQYAGELLRYRPAGLIGYSAVLDYFVRSLPDWHGRFRDLGLKFVMPCAEPSPKEDSFELLESVFGCPVIQEFGGVDFGHVGMKLGQDPFQVFGEHNLVEVEIEDKKGEAFLTTTDQWEIDCQTQLRRSERSESKDTKSTEGDSGLRLASQAGAVFTNPSINELVRDCENTSLTRSASGPADSEDLKLNSYKLKTPPPEASGPALVTSLYRRYLPLIRYRQGDVLGEVQRLRHGHVSRFEKLHGRLNDMVELADGTTIHSVSIFHCTHQEPSVLNIQMVLEDSGPKILLVTRDGYNVEMEMRIRNRLKQIAPSLGETPIEYVADVETTRAGKRRWALDRRTSAGKER